MFTCEKLNSGHKYTQTMIIASHLQLLPFSSTLDPDLCCQVHITLSAPLFV